MTDKVTAKSRAKATMTQPLPSVCLSTTYHSQSKPHSVRKSDRGHLRMSEQSPCDALAVFDLRPVAISAARFTTILQRIMEAAEVAPKRLLLPEKFKIKQRLTSFLVHTNTAFLSNTLRSCTLGEAGC